MLSCNIKTQSSYFTNFESQKPLWISKPRKTHTLPPQRSACTNPGCDCRRGAPPVEVKLGVQGLLWATTRPPSHKDALSEEGGQAVQQDQTRGGHSLPVQWGTLGHMGQPDLSPRVCAQSPRTDSRLHLELRSGKGMGARRHPGTGRPRRGAAPGGCTLTCWWICFRPRMAFSSRKSETGLQEFKHGIWGPWFWVWGRGLEIPRTLGERSRVNSDPLSSCPQETTSRDSNRLYIIQYSQGRIQEPGDRCHSVWWAVSVRKSQSESKKMEQLLDKTFSTFRWSQSPHTASVVIYNNCTNRRGPGLKLLYPPVF